jgi:hypothetical protein
MKKTSFASYLLGCSVFVLVGCAWFGDPSKSPEPNNQKPVKTAAAPGPGVKNAAGQTYYVVKADFTPLYRTGPQQPNGPDQSIAKDTLVVLLTKSFGYSRVQLDSGLNGYVATEDLALATPERVEPPKPVETVVEKLPTSRNSAIVEHYSVEKAASTSNANAEALPELPEPRLEPEPTPVVKPEFRY